MTDIEMYSEVLKSLANRAVQLGLNPDDLTVQRAHLKTDKALKEHLELTEKANDLGYTSLRMLVKAFTQIKEKPLQVDMSVLPEVFHKVPMVWLKGRPNSKRLKNGFAPMTPTQAKLKHALLMPLLIRVWAEIAGEEVLQNELIDAYLTTSASSFETDLFAYDEKIEDYCIYESVDEDRGPTLSELVKAYQVAEPEFDYGVGGVLETPEWD